MREHWGTDGDAGYDVTTFADVRSVTGVWLWQPYLPFGSVVVLDGDPGVGKTFVAIDLVARLSRGGPWPDGRELPGKLNSGFFTNHYDQMVLRPRAEAAGADLDSLIHVDYDRRGSPVFPTDRVMLGNLFTQHKMGLFVVDPLPLVLPASVGSHAGTAWHALDPLLYATMEAGTVAILVRHRTKAGRVSSFARGLGGISLAGAARSALVVERHPDDPDLRLLVQTKSNFGPIGPTLGFRIVDGTVRWEGPVDITAEEVGVEPEAARVKHPRERAAEWLKEQLADGPRKAAELIEAAAKRGIPLRTLERAKRYAKFQAMKRGPYEHAAWYWRDPNAAADCSAVSEGTEVVVESAIEAMGAEK